MSIVIVGGHDRMVYRYHDICKEHNCKSKVFTQMYSNMKTLIGKPDLLVLFTDTVSHKMVSNAIKTCDKKCTKIVRCHSSSACALKNILAEHC